MVVRFLFNLAFTSVVTVCVFGGGEWIHISLAQSRPEAILNRESKTKITTAQQYFNQGLKHYQQGNLTDFQAAQSSWEEALALWRQENNLPQIAVTLNFLCLVQRQLAPPTKALACYQELLTTAQALKDTQTEANGLVAIAQLQLQQGNYQEAFESLEKSLPLWQQANFKTGEVISQNELGQMYLTLGATTQAEYFYNKALAQAQSLGNRGNIAGIEHNLAQVKLASGDLKGALALEESAFQHWQGLIHDLGDRVTPDLVRGQAAGLNNLAFMQVQNKQLNLAQENYQKALIIWQQLGDKNGEASSLNNLGYLAFLQGDVPTAINYYQRALILRQTTGDRLKESLTRYWLAVAWKQQGEVPQAMAEIEQAIYLLENLRQAIGNDDLRASFLASKQDYYQFYIDLLMEQHQRQPNQGWDGKALVVSESAKARSLLDILAQTPGKITKGISSQLLNEKETIEQQLNTLQEKKIKLYSSNYDPQKQGELDQAITDLLQRYDRVLGQIERQNPDYSALTRPRPLDLPQIQALLDNETLLLEYALGKERSYLWVVSESSLRSYVLPGADQLDEAIKTFRQSFLEPTQRIRRPLAINQGAQLYSQLIPDPAMIAGKRLLIVPDGVLQYLPFGALVTDNPPGQPPTYLTDRHELVTMPSASTLGILRQNTAQRKPAPNLLAVFADPVFTSNDERLGTAIARLPDNLPVDLELSARDAGVYFDRLPYTEQEAEQLVALFPPEASLNELGFEATRARVFADTIEQYRFIHFATHGILNSKNPKLSGLVLSLLNPEGEPINGFVRLYDIFNLNLPADLVVLSACQTGLGQEIRGEGLIGLTRGFMYAGAARVVVSLWSVDDEATARLMTEFYRALLQRQMPPAAALQWAKQKLKEDPRFASPYFWAGFTLQGEWQNLRPTNQLVKGTSPASSVPTKRMGTSLN
ncbi:CHAT domain-containing tetratricopeptide repeat protein [Synechocystis sp. CACIAM 05]|uniref:CHAT domain-containing tetratricopeptide repeat protein n=1 Tax=Synechocystis sp. CACIAM 05 TaxID=1933929 RepID=UPI001F3DF0BA|nr:CHAT domain-containing protein [Synechocystis sp. CACIAM 05]